MRIILLFILSQPFLLLSQELNDISSSINQFGLDMCQELSQSPDYLISPASISTALGMTYLGAQGQTREQMKKVLYYPKEPAFLKGFSQFINVFKSTKPTTTISLANKLWAGKDRINLNPEFVKNNKKYFNSELETINFSDREKASQIINEWVATNTKEKILNLISPDLIDYKTVLILTNAIYFKSNWVNKFDANRTFKGKFTNNEKEKIPADYMCGKGRYNSFEDQYINIIELPYEGGKFSFLIFLPKTTLKELEDRLDINYYENCTEDMKMSLFEWIQVPKFKTFSKLELKDMLIKLGMPKAFYGANFSGIGYADGRIELSAVVHETFMDFNEQGTEAAAATGVVSVVKSYTPKKKFIVDRPFLYVLRHNESNSILFIGKISNPKY